MNKTKMNKTKMNKTKKRGGMRTPRSTSRPSMGRLSIKYPYQKPHSPKIKSNLIPDLETPRDLKEIQHLAEMRGDSTLGNILMIHDWDLKEKGKLLEVLFGATKDEYVKKDIDAELKRLKMKYYGNISNFSIKKLKELCDEIYLSMTPAELEFRSGFLNEDLTFPEDISDPDKILGRGFYIFWERGGEEYKPTVLMKIIKSNIDHEHDRYPNLQRLTGDEWEKQYERAYYENIYKALTRPIALGR